MATSRWLVARRVIMLLSSRWTVPVLNEIDSDGRRYHQLTAAVHGLSNKVLTETLRRAERDGLVARQLNASRRESGAYYYLTELGRSLDEPLEALAVWADEHWEDVEGARTRWDSRT